MGFGSRPETPKAEDPVPVPVEEDISFVEGARRTQEEQEDVRGSEASLLTGERGVGQNRRNARRTLGAGAALI